MPQYNLHIETERLILRPFDLQDIVPAYEMNLDAEVSKYTGDGGVVSMEETERRIKEDVFSDYQKHGFGRLAVQLKGGPRFIGFAGLKYLEDIDEVDVGYRFMSAYWGKGYATEAAKACVEFGFQTLQLKRMLGFVLAENPGSIRVLEKLGFSYEKDVLEDGLVAQQYALQR